MSTESFKRDFNEQTLNEKIQKNEITKKEEIAEATVTSDKDDFWSPEKIAERNLPWIVAAENLHKELEGKNDNEKILEIRKRIDGAEEEREEIRKRFPELEQGSEEKRKNCVKKYSLEDEYGHILKSNPLLCREVYVNTIKKYIEKELNAGRTLQDIDTYFIPRSKELDLITDSFISIYGAGDPQSVILDEIIEQFKQDGRYTEKQNTTNAGKEIPKTVTEDTLFASGKNLKNIDTAEKQETANEFIKENIIKNYLSYKDTGLSEELKKKMLEYNMQSGNAMRYAEAIIEFSKKYNLNMLEQKSGEMVGKCLDVLKNIGIKPSDYAVSKTWANWDVAKQFYYFTHPEEINPKYKIQDPLSSANKSQEIINRHVGWEIYRAYNQGKEREFLYKIKDIGLREQIKEMLNSAPKENGTLSSWKLAELGLLIGEAIKGF